MDSVKALTTLLELKNVFDKLCTVTVDFMDEKIVPNFVTPLTNAIAHRR